MEAELVEEGARLFKRNGKGEKASKEAEGADYMNKLHPEGTRSRGNWSG